MQNMILLSFQKYLHYLVAKNRKFPDYVKQTLFNKKVTFKTQSHLILYNYLNFSTKKLGFENNFVFNVIYYLIVTNLLPPFNMQQKFTPSKKNVYK